MRPLQDAAPAAPRPEFTHLSDDKLLRSVQHPKNGDPVTINTHTGELADGNGRITELQTRAADPKSPISFDMLIPVDWYTPDLSMFPDL